MEGPAADAVTAPQRRRTGCIVVTALGVVAVLAAVTVGFLVVREVGRDVPQFPSLAQSPDPTLHGTVAYFSPGTQCVRVVAAAGSPAKDVLCLPNQDVAKAEKLGKEIGPQLAWRPDGRLEVTMFRMTGPPPYTAGWQKVVDVRTGQVEDVPAAQVPAQPNLGTRPTVSPDGRRITTRSDRGGEVEVTLTDPNGATRTLLAAHGPGESTYGMHAAFWSPDWRWIAADDGRILVITPDDPSVTRVLTDETVGGMSGDESIPWNFAVTEADLVTGTSGTTAAPAAKR